MSAGLLVAIPVLGIAAVALGAAAAAWWWGLCVPSTACLGCCSRGRNMRQPWMETKVSGFHPPRPSPLLRQVSEGSPTLQRGLARLSQMPAPAAVQRSLAQLSSQVGSVGSSQHGLARTSLNSDVARPVTVVNETLAPVQLFWVNYDGEPEDLAVVAPGARRLLRTFATHIWRFKDARSGAPVTEDVRREASLTEVEVGMDTQCVRIRVHRRGGLCAVSSSGLATPPLGRATPQSGLSSPPSGLATISSGR
ncbi:hypothetical protein WJX81_007968 [Elliptochloris bilobata]|uniref:von Hippel-Lindau disease tumour suppressor beta domain-containing protein n=1 Tax=Elliptochloris bilobata TaxID=381761 RepID=A0AAW1QV90_9CHLO